MIGYTYAISFDFSNRNESNCSSASMCINNMILRNSVST